MGASDDVGAFYAPQEHEAETKRRWQRLMERHGDAVDRERGVVVHFDPPDGSFCYRPGQFLSTARDADRVGNLLDDAGVDPVPLPRPPRRRSDRRDGGGGGVVRWRLPMAVELTTTLRSLRQRSAGRHEAAVRVAPNHVFFGEQGWVKFGPGGAPFPVDRPSFTEDDFLLPPGAGRGIRIAVLDTGIMQSATTTHPILTGRYDDDSGEETPDVDPLYDDVTDRVLALEGGHGTFIAGLVAICAPGAKLEIEASLHPDGTTDEMMLAEDLPDIGDAEIVNLSLGGFTAGDEPPIALESLVESLAPTRVVVAAAGNEASTRPFWPAAFTSVLGVGAVAVDHAGQPVPAAFTNTGQWVNCCAEGVDVVSTYVPGVYRTAAGEERRFDSMARWSGTSFAAPRVAGLVAAAATTWGVDVRAARDRLLATATQHVPGLGPFLGESLLRPAR